MARFLESNRKRIGSLDVIDMDDAAAANLRIKLRVPHATEVRWNNWVYRSELAELRQLYEKGKRSQWNATTDILWDTPLTKDEWLGDPEWSIMARICRTRGLSEATQKAAMFDEIAWLLSQLLHGEHGALQICGQLTNLCPTTDEKFYAASQTADEARHTEVFARLLAEKFGVIHPISVVGKAVLDELLTVEGYYMKTLGMQTLFGDSALCRIAPPLSRMAPRNWPPVELRFTCVSS